MNQLKTLYHCASDPICNTPTLSQPKRPFSLKNLIIGQNSEESIKLFTHITSNGYTLKIYAQN